MDGDESFDGVKKKKDSGGDEKTHQSTTIGNGKRNKAE